MGFYQHSSLFYEMEVQATFEFRAAGCSKHVGFHYTIGGLSLLAFA